MGNYKKNRGEIMYAVFRETSYDPDNDITKAEEFREFQEIHAGCDGYIGTVVTNAGQGRHLTITLWDTSEDMKAARKKLVPVVQQLIGPLMDSPSKLLGTGPVVVNDVIKPGKT
jgi:hypothetical protein